jgi:hypothetical protein
MCALEQCVAYCNGGLDVVDGTADCRGMGVSVVTCITWEAFS